MFYNNLKKDKFFHILSFSILFSLLILIILGRFEAKIVPDTNGYLLGPYENFLNLWDNLRAPFFGILLEIFNTKNSNYLFFPFFVISLYFCSIIFLFYSQKEYGLSSMASLSMPLGLVFSNPLILYSNYVHPELLSITLIIFSISFLILLLKYKNNNKLMYAIVIFSALSYLLKPMFIIFIITLPFLFYILDKEKKHKSRIFLKLFILLILPFIFISSIRYISVKDFNISSFGGFQMSGIAGLMIENNSVSKLSKQDKKMGIKIIEQKNELISERKIFPIPLNSKNKRSFVSTSIGYYDILARDYDTILNEIMLKLKNSDENWIDYNSRMQNFTFSVIKNNPLYYASWIIGGSIRFIGRVFISNLSFIISFIILIILFFSRNNLSIYSKKAFKSKFHDNEELFFIIKVSSIYTFSIAVMCILITFPAARYIDSAGITLASIPIFLISKLLIKEKKTK